MKSLNFFVVAGLVLVLGACTDAPVAPEEVASPATSPVAPRFDFTNGPAAPGPVVSREDGDLFLFINDPETGLVAVFGLPEDPTNLDVCGGSEPLQTIPTQLLNLPGSDAIALIQKGGDRNVVVYDGPSFLSHPNFCAAFAGGTILARGTARLVRTDNDITGFGGPGVNSFGATAHGIVQDETSGEFLTFRAVARFLLMQDGTFRRIVSEITLGS